VRTWALQAKHVEVEVDINLDPNAHLNKPAAVKEESPLQPGVPDMQVLQERERAQGQTLASVLARRGRHTCHRVPR
jgi:hypothetical protein